MNINTESVKIQPPPTASTPSSAISGPTLPPTPNSELTNDQKADSNNLNEKIFSSVYAPVRFNQLFQTPYMREGGKVLDKNTGLFSYQPVNLGPGAGPTTRPATIDAPQVPLNKTNVPPVKELKFVPPSFQDLPKDSKPAELPKNTTTTQSKDEPSHNISNNIDEKPPTSNLKRTISSPNIVKLDEETLNSPSDQDITNENSKDFLKTNTTRALAEKPAAPKAWNLVANNLNTNTNPMMPRVNRNNKPMPDHVVNSRIEELQPVYGNVPTGLTGIRNFGNTCFMNFNFFLKNQYKNDLNRSNDLGFRGEIADEFCVIVKAIWGGHCRIISPYRLRSIIAQFNQQFISNDQQDSQELLLFLLDGLHEDLNRVKKLKFCG